MLQRATLTQHLENLFISDCSKDEKLVRLLQLGCESLDLVLGVISKITKPDYEIVMSYPDGLVNRGSSFRLQDTICDITVLSDEVTSFAKASGTNWATHPAYETFSIEAYIGIRYELEGKIAGTLNFTSPSAHPKGFSVDDDDKIRLLSQACAKILS